MVNLEKLHPAYGTCKSESARKKISESRKGKKMSPEQKAKLLAANLGIKHSPERIANRVKAQSGEKHWLYGKNHSEKSIQKMKKSQNLRYKNNPIGPRAKNIIQYSLEGLFIKEWNSACEASKIIGCSPQAISNCANGRIKKSNGFIWGYKNEKIVPISYNKIMQYDLRGNLVKEWENIPKIIKEMKCTYSAISHCIKGITKTSQGFVWKEKANILDISSTEYSDPGSMRQEDANELMTSIYTGVYS